MCVWKKKDVMRTSGAHRKSRPLACYADVRAKHVLHDSIILSVGFKGSWEIVSSSCAHTDIFWWDKPLRRATVLVLTLLYSCKWSVKLHLLYYYFIFYNFQGSEPNWSPPCLCFSVQTQSRQPPFTHLSAQTCCTCFRKRNKQKNTSGYSLHKTSSLTFL